MSILHSKRVEKMYNYTRNKWRRCKTTLERSGEDIHMLDILADGRPVVINQVSGMSPEEMQKVEENLR